MVRTVYLELGGSEWGEFSHFTGSIPISAEKESFGANKPNKRVERTQKDP